MHLTTNESTERRSHSKVSRLLLQYNHQVLTETRQELKMLLRTFERTRSLVLWHDHGTILGLGCIIITVHIDYNQAVFFTQEEYEARYGK